MFLLLVENVAVPEMEYILSKACGSYEFCAPASCWQPHRKCKFIQHSYVKTAVIRGTYAKECNAEVREALGDNVLPMKHLKAVS
jgi:hypothetical protein